MRILLVSNDPIGRRMAGPGARYYHLAQELGRRHDVALMAPALPDIEVPGVELLEAARFPSVRFVRLARGFDALVAQQLSPWTMRALARADVKVVYDLYDPLVVEVLPLLAESSGSDRARDATHRSVALVQLVALATGDAFVCASERQRDFWLGLLAALGRLDVACYAADPTLRRLVDVVPFGLEADPPAGGEPVLKGVLPGLREGDRLLLWGGGVWSWFDPLTVVRSLAAIARERDDVKLFFLGLTHPKPTIGPMPMAEQVRRLAHELGLAGTHVFFNEGWVPYAERGSYLAEADLGVSAHFESVETRLAFRTRLLDYFWAGLPTVTTRGDALGDLVGDRRLGRSVDYEDAGGFARAVLELLDDPGAYAEAQSNLSALRSELAWPRVAARLEAVLVAPPSARPARGSTRLALRSSWATFASGVATEGTRATVSQAVRLLRRPRVP